MFVIKILGGNFILANEVNSMKKVDNTQKYWFHRIDNLDVIPQINAEKCIGSSNARSKTIKDITAGDRIFLISKRKNNIEFFGYTQVEETFADDESLFEYYESRKKLKLKGIKYFSKPISTRDMAEYLDVIEDKKKSSNFFRSEYREIPKEDFIKIRKKANLVNYFPSYLEEYSRPLKEFLLSTIRAVFRMVKHYEKVKQIEIKYFLRILKKFLDEYGINKTLSEIQEFYGRNAIELGFRHVPSRDPDKFVPLYLSNGETKNFAYIILE